MVRTTLLTILFGLAMTASASAASECSDDIAKNIQTARRALDASTSGPLTTEDRKALSCALDEIAKLDAKIEGLRNGTVPFSGKINLPKGFVARHTSDQETR
jgi:hypothetical protein